ncbi:unnamed protein product, partial [Didymodactylos carnosus]
EPSNRELPANRMEPGLTDFAGDVQNDNPPIDKETVRMNKFRSNKSRDFQLRVKVFQARQLDGSNLYPVCRVRAVGHTRQTKICKGTNEPQFNEVFFFNFNMTEAEMYDEIIEFE